MATLSGNHDNGAKQNEIYKFYRCLKKGMQILLKTVKPWEINLVTSNFGFTDCMYRLLFDFFKKGTLYYTKHLINIFMQLTNIEWCFY